MRALLTAEERYKRKRDRQKAYEQSGAGKATRRKYLESAKGREAVQRHTKKQWEERLGAYGMLFCCIECKQELQLHHAKRLFGKHSGLCRECVEAGE